MLGAGTRGGNPRVARTSHVMIVLAAAASGHLQIRHTGRGLRVTSAQTERAEQCVAVPLGELGAAGFDTWRVRPGWVSARGDTALVVLGKDSVLVVGRLPNLAQMGEVVVDSLHGALGERASG